MYYVQMCTLYLILLFTAYIRNFTHADIQMYSKQSFLFKFLTKLINPFQ